MAVKIIYCLSFCMLLYIRQVARSMELLHWKQTTCYKTCCTTTTTNVRIIVLPSHSCGGTSQNLHLKLLRSSTPTSVGGYKWKICLSRRDSVLLIRPHIVHSRLTHSYLLSGDDIPECGTCECPLTVMHILMECFDFTDVRNKHFVATSSKDLFENVEAQNIIDFIKETLFYKQL